MYIRSGKIQFLFWMSFFSIVVYLWIITVGLQTFVLPDEKPVHVSQSTVFLLFALFLFLGVMVVVGTIIATMINSRAYQKFFGIFTAVSFATLLFIKSIFG